MPIPEKYLAEFEEAGIYHIYNRTNNNEKLFITNENRLFFLRKYKEILSSFTGTYCWCLLPNHFHLLIKIKTKNEIINYLQAKPQTTLTITEKKFLKSADLLKAGSADVTFSELIEQTFKRFFQSYALAFNKQHDRKGNLFYKPFKRVRIKKDSQFTMAVIYIHVNAAKHKLVKEFANYRWSSWQSIISSQVTSLLKDEVIDWFGNLETCLRTHKELAEYYYNCDIAIEE